jgi:hypothetical protein
MAAPLEARECGTASGALEELSPLGARFTELSSAARIGVEERVKQLVAPDVADTQIVAQ